MLIVQLCKVDQLSSHKQSDSVWHLSSLSSNTLKSVFVFQLTKLPVYQIHHKPWLFSLRAPPGMPKRPLLCVEVTQEGIECQGRQLGHTAVGSGSGTGPDFDLEILRIRGATSLWCSQFFKQVAQWSSIFGSRVVFYHVLSNVKPKRSISACSKVALIGKHIILIHFFWFSRKEETTPTPRQHALLRCGDADARVRAAGGAMFRQRQNSYNFWLFKTFLDSQTEHSAGRTELSGVFCWGMPM